MEIQGSIFDDQQRAKLLEKFMKEHFPYAQFKKAGFFTKEMRNNYQAQAYRVCLFFGYKSVYEYRSKEIRCHVSFAGDRPLSINDEGQLAEEPFVTVIKPHYED